MTFKDKKIKFKNFSFSFYHFKSDFIVMIVFS